MGDKKLSQLPLVVEPKPDDILYIVHEPSTIAQSSIIKVSDLGGGSTTDTVSDGFEPTTIAHIETGRGGLLCLTENGKVYSARAASDLAYFTGTTVESNVTPVHSIGEQWTRVYLPTVEKIMQIKVIGQCGYALDELGNLFAVGENQVGNLGLGFDSTNPILTFTLSTTNVIRIFGYENGFSRSNNHLTSCFIQKTDGYIYGCGYNAQYNLGLGNNVNRPSWTRISSLDSNASDITNIINTTQQSPTIAYTSTNKILVCGVNNNYELGTNNNINITEFTDHTALWNPDYINVEKVDITQSGDSFGIYVILSDATKVYMRVCGYNYYGQLGTGTKITIKIPATSFEVLGQYHEFKIESQLTAALLIDNTGAERIGPSHLYKCGENSKGIIGDGTTNDVTSMKRVDVPGVEIKEICTSEAGSINYVLNTMSYVRGADDFLYGCGFNGDASLRQSGTIASSTNITTYSKVLIPKNVSSKIKKVDEMDGSSEGRTFFTLGEENGIAYVWGINGPDKMLFSTKEDNVQIPTAIMPTVWIQKGYI